MVSELQVYQTHTHAHTLVPFNITIIIQHLICITTVQIWKATFLLLINTMIQKLIKYLRTGLTYMVGNLPPSTLTKCFLCHQPKENNPFIDHSNTTAAFSQMCTGFDTCQNYLAQLRINYTKWLKTGRAQL